MTQEEKAQAYDEALEKAKIEINTKGIGETVNLCEQLFPELRESEDEGIRKSLIKFLTDIKEISESGRTTWAVRKEDAEMCKSFLDYLGKQKVQNEITIEQVYKEFITPEKLKDAKTNKYIREQLLWELTHNGIITEVDYQYLTDDKRKPWTAEEYQKEQKPLTDEKKEYIRTIKSIISDFIRDKKPENLAYYQRIYDWLDGRHVPFSCGHENGTAEWSEEDKAFLKVAIATCNRYSHKDIADWLKSLPERLNLQPKEEWSEEDEEMMTDIIESLEYAYPNDNEFRIAWLKSLRPSWKPSEEQMKALCSKLPVVKGRGDKVQDILETLYYDLKKRGVKEESDC